MFICNECEKPFQFLMSVPKVFGRDVIQTQVSPCCQSDEFEEAEALAVYFEEDTLTEETEEVGAFAMAGGNGLEDERPEDSY